MFRKSKLPNSSEQRLRDLGAPESSASEARLLALGDQVQQKSHSSWKRRIVIVLATMLTLVLVGGAGAAGYTFWRYSQVHKLSLGGVLDSGSSGPMTVLIVGSDSRRDLVSGQKKQFGSGAAVAGQRSDTIMLLRVDPSTQRAAILSLPRDLYVTISGGTHKDRINSAFDGGASELIKTIKENFNIPIDHYAEVNFDTFRAIVNNIGGVEVPFATPVRDFDPTTGRNFSGLDIPRAGCIKLDGNQALAYVRSRHYEIYEGGRWRSDPLSDLGRVKRQQDFIRRVAHKAVDKGKTNPLTLNALISSSVKNITVDNGLTVGDITRLARRFQSLDPTKIEMYTMPTTAKVIGGADVLVPDQREANATIDKFMNGVPKEPKETTTTNARTSSAPTTAAAVSRFVPSTPTC